jgi:hypothetical protein
MAWYSGKKVNLDFTVAARAHALDCPTCGREPWTSEKEHNAWRTVAEDHMGTSLPSTFVEEPKPAKVMSSQFKKPKGNVRLDIEAKKYD